jgi:hypothetical protein
MTPETTASLRQADRLERRSVRCAAHDPQQDGIGAKLMTCGLVALIALALTGCRVRSVNKASYVAKNEQVLRGIPVFRNAKLISDFSIGHTASDAPLGQENGPPFGSYTTWHQFQRQEAASCTTVGDWYRRVFRRLGWHRTAAGIVGVGYFRDHAFVYFDCGNSSIGGIGFSLSADYNER